MHIERPSSELTQQYGKIVLVVLLLLMLTGGVLLLTPWFKSPSTDASLPDTKDMTTSAPDGQRNASDKPSSQSPELSIDNSVQNVDALSQSAANTEQVVASLEEQQKRLLLMKEKALEYSEKRLELLQKCRDYELLGMLEEKKLECLDYLAEKRADEENAERQELRKKLKRKFDDDGNE